MEMEGELGRALVSEAAAGSVLSMSIEELSVYWSLARFSSLLLAFGPAA
jgi:hypothetical protein